MKWFWTSLIVLALSAMTLPACGGRAQLGPESAKQYRELFRVQGNSRPRSPLGKLSARDAKLIMQNHNATYGGKGKASNRGARSNASLKPQGVSLEGGGSQIKIQAR